MKQWLRKTLRLAPQLNDSSYAGVRRDIDLARTPEDLDQVWEMMASVGYDPDGILGRALRHRREEMTNG